MYAEIGRAAEVSARRYWPVRGSCRGEREIAEALTRSMTASGWRTEGEDLALPGQEEGSSPLDLVLDLRGWSGRAEQEGRLEALTAALALMGGMHLPLRRGLRWTRGSSSSGGEILVFRPAHCIESPDGILIAPGRSAEEGLIIWRATPLLERARQALQNAGFAPHIGLDVTGGWGGLGFIAPGEPVRDLTGMTRAIQALASLFYGLAGYGVMAFQFDSI